MYARIAQKESEPKLERWTRFGSERSRRYKTDGVVLPNWHRDSETPLIAHHQHGYEVVSCKVLIALEARAVSLLQLTRW